MTSAQWPNASSLTARSFWGTPYTLPLFCAKPEYKGTFVEPKVTSEKLSHLRQT